MPQKARAKLRGKVKTLASKFIAEEMRTKQYPRAQAQAIGISRARKQAKLEKDRQALHKLGRKYKTT